MRNPSLERLSFFEPRSGPTIGVGVSTTLNVASLAATVSRNHSFCAAPQIVLSGLSGSVLALRATRPSTSQICRSFP